ncbi:hypothetical protein MNBD_GAMMA07-2231 [hydrothermal vent metagenome]|uniref:HPt domain-containing protein n=1 Tax=hydrothermal vent metagenome TaxID=652676 RepID=A0A3B0WZR1_9ZZZZ
MTSVIDAKVFDEIAELMEDSLGLFIETFLENSPKLIQNIRTALTEDDYEKVMVNAHQLKGGSGSIGVMQVFALAKQMEEDVKQNKHDQLKSAFTALEDAYVQAEVALRAHL